MLGQTINSGSKMYNPTYINKNVQDMIISTTGDDLLRIDMPGIESPLLTSNRKKAVNTQLLRFLANRDPDDDSELTKLVYMTFDHMPFYYLQDFISKALWYYSDYDLMYDRGDYLSIYKAFYEQQKPVKDWHLKYGRTPLNYDVYTQRDRLERKIQYNVINDDCSFDLNVNDIYDLSFVDITLIGLSVYLFVKLLKRK